jgi:antirestriction protein ArdC
MSTSNSRPELLTQLTEGVQRLTTSSEWQRYLDFQSRFHHYSFGNVLLIAAQCHEATQVAGFRAWQKMDRFVRKGEKAIFIIAPMVYKKADAADGDDDRVLWGFKWVPVFDVGQTDGEELPSICNRLAGDDPAGIFAQLVAVARSIGYHVVDAELPGSTNGDCTYDLHRIRVEVSNSPAQRLKTLAHEIAHAMLHEGVKDRHLTELEAESTAYVVCASLGINSEGYSFGYVATWAGGSDEARDAIRASGARIQRAADQILTAISGEDLVEVA